MRCNSGISRVDRQFWADLILEAGEIDLGDPLPVLDERFVSVWASHYATIAGMTRPEGSVLEIGAGYAVLAAGLGQVKNAAVWATEHPTRAYVFRRGYRSFLRSHNVCLIAQDLREGLPFQNDSFNRVYGCDVIEHLLPNDVPTFLSETVRILKPGGELILSSPNRLRLGNRARRILGLNIQPAAPEKVAGDTLGHVREYSLREIIRRLKQHGLQPIRHAFGLIPHFTEEDFAQAGILSHSAARWVNRITAWFYPLFPSLGDEMYVLSRKV